MTKRMTADELQDAGFEEPIEYFDTSETPTTPPPSDRKDVAPYVVVDNSEQLIQLNRSNELMREALNEMVEKLATVGQRPKHLDLEIKRTSAGFIDKARITLKY